MDTAQFETLKLMQEKRRKLESLDQKKKAITKNMNKEIEAAKDKLDFHTFNTKDELDFYTLNAKDVKDEMEKRLAFKRTSLIGLKVVFALLAVAAMLAGGGFYSADKNVIAYSLIFGGIAFLVISFKLVGVICKKKNDSRVAKIEAEFAPLIKEAEEKDAEAKKRFEEKDAEAKKLFAEACNEINDRISVKYAEKLRGCDEEIKQCRAEYYKIKIISDKDFQKNPKIIEKIIDLMESGRADTVKEALNAIDNEEREILNQKSREESEILNQKSRTPGTLYIQVDAYINEVFIDGQSYGAISKPYGTIKLNPGLHNILVICKAGGMYIESQARQFNMEGDGKLFYKFYPGSSPVVMFKECSNASFT